MRSVIASPCGLGNFGVQPVATNQLALRWMRSRANIEVLPSLDALEPSRANSTAGIRHTLRVEHR